jgi:competence ComEA-like helix-hairpin-helix protein
MPRPVNLNRATMEELVELPGIGKTLAERIIAHRERGGGFHAVTGLLEVAGMTERLVSSLRDRLTTSEGSAEPEEAAALTVILDPGDDGGDYEGFRVTASGSRKEEDLTVPFLASAFTSAKGEATLPVPDREAIVGSVTVEVLRPDGAVAASVSRPGSALPLRLEIDVAPGSYGTTQPNRDPAAGLPARVRGRVIDETGKAVPAGLQVVLWGAQADNPVDADFRALVVTTTDSLGHFTGPYPVGTFTAAHAAVAIGEDPQNVTIHLKEGLFPESVILVVRLPSKDALAPDDEECGCHGVADPPRSPDSTELARADGTFSSDPGAGRCVDFTKPDRTLEEFTYSYVVRTTEPEIRGFTLAEPPKIDLGRIKDLVLATAAPAAAEMAAPVLMRSGAEGTTTVHARMVASEPAGEVLARELEGAKVDARVLKTLARDPDGFSLTTLAKSFKRTSHADLLRLLGRVAVRPPGRKRMSCDNAVDWDDDPTIYQACTIAHGHILRFKQEWVADGYSMGNLLYSLPLAPGQKKQISVVDWERREAAGRTEILEAEESLEALIQRDRDVSDVVTGVVNERTRGGSRSSSSAVAGGFGIGAIGTGVGGLLGVGGGRSSANSSSWQVSSRSTAASALNQLRDRTVQSASAVRSQRSSVVQTVRQGERVAATTESVANYNHCHAITIQYFEVLRHLLVRQRLTDVQECLFVPLLMSRFTDDKALRWRDTLGRAVPRALRRGFDALDRIENNYAGSDLPLGRYADEQILSVDGDLRLRFQLARPKDKDDDTFDASAWHPLLSLFGFNPRDFYDAFLKDQRFKDRIFLEQLGPRIASTVVSLLKVHALKTDGSTADLHVDPTLVTTFQNDRELYVTLRMQQDPDTVNRSQVKAVIISSRLQLPGLPFVIDALPAGSRLIVESGSMRYRTAHHEDFLFRSRAIRNDLTGHDDVRIETPLNRQELRNPREEDKESARKLLDHLNEHIERYHHAIWARMSDDRRYMLLDGFQAPNAGGRSVASVVDNELIGMVGNCLVLPVARGYHLDPTFNQDAEKPVDLLEHYEPNTPMEPLRIALPTKGVYAEAVMGACNSCEHKDEARFWRWEESPIPDSPPAILPTSTDTRRAEPPDLTAKDLPAPIIAMQSAPAAPDPAGVAGVLQLLGQSGIFRDMAGLEGTQRNAAAALEQAFQTATTFGTKAADLALQGKMAKDVDKAMRTIQAAKTSGLLTDEQAQELTQTAIRGLVGAGATNPPKATTTDELKDLTNTAGAQKAAVKVSRPTGEQVEVDARSTEDAPRPVILLDGDTASAEHRAFRPSAGDKTLIIQVGATFRNAPAGSRLRWSSPTPGALTIDNPNAAKTRVRGVTPGVHDLDVELLDGGGTRIASMKLKVSVPQCVRVTESAADLDAALTDAKLAGKKDDVLAEVKRVAEHLLARANVRVFWEVGGLAEAVPAHVPASNVVVATIKNKDPNGNLGVTFGPAAGDTFDETIEVFPGMYSEDDAIDVDTETQALIVQLESSVPGDPDLVPIATKVYGRLIGETLSHEIGHALLWDDIPADGHNSPAIPNDLMNRGVDRLFGQRTGMENTAQVSPVLPEHYVDHGLNAIGGFQAVNQGLIDGQWPVPPAFG